MPKNFITDECISCGACAAECPNEAISEGADHYEVDPDKCTGCDGNEHACAAVCPMGACTDAED